MTTDVNKAIQDLLFEQTAVIVPGLGGFTSTPGAATVDYVQDIITPPASKLDFNPNLIINDGVLVQYLQKGNMSTYQEAEALVESFVALVRGTLERREIYEIPKVGRLYQDYEQKIRFMPEGNNFNAESFGLPTVEFQPLLKEKPKLMPTPPKPATETVVGGLTTGVDAATPIVAEEPPTSVIMKVFPWMVLLAAILIALTLYKIFGGPRQPVADLPQATERINVKPALPAEENTTTETPAKEPSSDAGITTPNEDSPATTPPVAEQPKPEPPKQATAAPKTEVAPKVKVEPSPKVEEGANSYYLVVHSFGKQGNASKFASTLKGDGYSTRTRQVGNLYRVGVLFKSQAEMEKERAILANKYKAGPKTEKELAEMGQ